MMVSSRRAGKEPDVRAHILSNVNDVGPKTELCGTIDETFNTGTGMLAINGDNL